jgi:F420-dependent oxidoreductase-like protein
MGANVRFGTTVPQIKRSWQDAKEVTVLLDELGYDTAWVCDHLFGVPFPNAPIFEAYTELSALAAVTTSIELGALVTPPFFRPPAVLAKQLATLDQISNGRAIAGLGVGWNGAEFEGYGCEFPNVGRRLRALEESCEIMKRLWTEETTDFEGSEYKLVGAVCEPKPVRRPPILIGGGGEKVLLAIAARHADIWNNMAVTQNELAKKIEVLHRHCDAVGRDPSQIEVSQQCLVVIAPTEQEAVAAIAKADRVYGGHMGSDLEENGFWGTPQGVIDRIGAHVEKGCGHFVIEFFGRYTRAPATLFAEEVMPAFRA